MNDFIHDVAAVTAILDYLNMQNRPYSAVDILNNLHKEYGKTVLFCLLHVHCLHCMLSKPLFFYTVFIFLHCYDAVGCTIMIKSLSKFIH